MAADVITLADSPEGLDNINADHDTEKSSTNDPTTTSNENNSSLPSKQPNTPSEFVFKFGPYIPIIRKENGICIDPRGIVSQFNEAGNISPSDQRLMCEVLPDDAIVEAPSLYTPLLLKKKTIWPEKEIGHDEESESDDGKEDSNDADCENSAEDVQVVKVVRNNESSKLGSSCNSPKPSNDYMKATAVASLTKPAGSILSIDDFYKSSVGEMLIGIGLSRVREFNLEIGVKRLSTKIKRSSENNVELAKEHEALKNKLTESKMVNKAYKSDEILRCPHCPFKSDSLTILSGHLEAPHVNSKREYTCNWCQYKIKDSNQIVFHCLVEHKKRCRIDKPAALHNCTFCQYECRSKRKLVSHLTKCEQNHKQESFLGPQEFGENDYPTITSKLITRDDVRTYEETIKALRLGAYNPYQIKVPTTQQQGSSTQQVLVVPGRSLPSTSAPITIQRPEVYTIAGQNPHPVGSPIRFIHTNPVPSQNSNRDVSNSTQLLHLLSTNNTNLRENRSTMLQYPKNQSSQFVNGKSIMETASGLIITPRNRQANGTTVNPSSLAKELTKNNESSSGNSKVLQRPTSPISKVKSSTFVICEICDGYIKDLSQLKSHMQWIHKVKIHQKMLESRPPLNCQKCRWRFFTDQGLERHLLGVHGLVTSNMQEQVDKGTDSGRCTVCGRAYANKLVAHMKEVHKSHLKPAHLSYKCTVCSATFNLYRLFENHVYSVHNEPAKRATSN